MYNMPTKLINTPQSLVSTIGMLAIAINHALHQGATLQALTVLLRHPNPDGLKNLTFFESSKIESPATLSALIQIEKQDGTNVVIDLEPTNQSIATDFHIEIDLEGSHHHLFSFHSPFITVFPDATLTWQLNYFHRTTHTIDTPTKVKLVQQLLPLPQDWQQQHPFAESILNALNIQVSGCVPGFAPYSSIHPCQKLAPSLEFDFSIAGPNPLCSFAIDSDHSVLFADTNSLVLTGSKVAPWWNVFKLQLWQFLATIEYLYSGNPGQLYHLQTGTQVSPASIPQESPTLPPLTDTHLNYLVRNWPHLLLDLTPIGANLATVPDSLDSLHLCAQQASSKYPLTYAMVLDAFRQYCTQKVHHYAVQAYSC